MLLGRTKAFHFILIVLSRPMAIIGAGFMLTPGELRVYPQQPAVFLWTVDVDIEDSNFKRFSYNDVEFYSERNSAFQYGGGYEQRTNVTVDTRELGFTLYQITASDTGPNYKCTVDDREDLRIEDDDAHIFLYGVPSTPTFSSSPTDAVENMQYTITCTSESNSSPRSGARPMVYNWTRGGIPPPTDRHSTSGEGGSTLVINPVLREDTGIIYTCTVQESDSILSSSGDMVMDVKYPPGKPTFQGPTEPLVEGSSSLTLTCSLTGDSLGNPPAHEYRWWNTESSYSNIQSGNTLTVDDVSVNKHDGLWRCEAINTIDKEPSDESTVTVHSPATIHTDPGPSVSVLYNETLSVLCEVRARPAASISWRYEGGDTLPSGVQPQSSTRSDGKYTITSSTLQWRSEATDAERRNSSGDYTCTGANSVGGRASSEVALVVLYGPFGISLSNPGPIVATEGDHTSVTCTSECSPSCQYTWTRASDNQEVHEGAILDFPSIDRSDHDVYTCRSSNSYGERSTSVTINVNFPTSITDFEPSSDTTLNGETVSLTCSVASRPESVIRINSATSLLNRTVGHQAIYTFSSASILDSGNYRCNAENGIGAAAPEQSTDLNVQGGFHFCNNQTSNITRGLALKSSFIEEICEFANPFNNITKANLTFSERNGTRVMTDLPDDIMIHTENTDHALQKIINFKIPVVNPEHYGEYRMTSSNQFEAPLVFTMHLTPEGPPEAPYNLRCTDTTAVSLTLEWKVGHDGGSDQTFLLHYNNTGTGETRTKSIDGSGLSRGSNVHETLLEVDGILPNQTYWVTIEAENAIGNTPADISTVNKTLARPVFVGEPTIQYEGSVAFIYWPIENLHSVTHIETVACDSAKKLKCQTTNVTEPSVQPFEVELPEAESFVFNFTFYDGRIKVHSVSHTPDEKDPDFLIMIIGVVVGVVCAAAVIILFVVLWRKGIIPVGEKPPHRNRNGAMAGNQNSAFDNPASVEEVEDISPYNTSAPPSRDIVDDISPYGSTPGTQVTGGILTEADTISPYGSTPASTSAVGGKANGSSIEGEKNVYADVRKEKKQPAVPDVYSEIRKDRKQPGKPLKSSKGETERTGNGTRPESVYPPAKAPKPKNIPPLKSGGINDPKQEYENVELAEKNGTMSYFISPLTACSKDSAAGPYANVVAATQPEGAYSEVSLHGGFAAGSAEGAYQNFGKMKQETTVTGNFQFIGDDGIAYAQLDMMVEAQKAAREAAARGIQLPPPVIHGLENRSEYASIDAVKTQQMRK